MIKADFISKRWRFRLKMLMLLRPLLNVSVRKMNVSAVAEHNFGGESWNRGSELIHTVSPVFGDTVSKLDIFGISNCQKDGTAYHLLGSSSFRL